SLTGMPAAAIAFEVPPVEISSTLRSCSAFARSIRPVLSDTDRSARRSGTRSGAGIFFETTAMVVAPAGWKRGGVGGGLPQPASFENAVSAAGGGGRE